MNFIAVFQKDSGELLSVGSVVNLPLPDHLASIDCGAERPTGVWSALTHTFEPPAPVSVVPHSVTMRQARLALDHAGLLDQVDAAVAAMPGDAGRAARIEWEYSGEVQRNKPLVLALGPALGLDDAALDQLFIAAAKL